MAEAIILEFSGAPEMYESVNKILGINHVTGEGDWPAGMLSHTGAIGDDGKLLVFEVWDSVASQEAFMANRLGPALGQAGAPDPDRIEWKRVLGHHVG
jgi:hypothetical protein